MKNVYQNLWRIFRHLPQARRWQAVGLILMMVISGAAEVVSISAFVPLLSEITNIPETGDAGGQDDSIFSGVYTILFFASAYTMANFLRIGFRWLELRFQAIITHDLATLSINRMVRKDYLEILTADSGQFIGNLLHDVDETGAFVKSTMAFLNSLLISLALFTTVFLLNPNVASYIAAGLLVTYTTVTIYVRTPLRNNGKLISNSVAERSKIIREILGHFELIKISRNFSVFINPFLKADWNFRLRKIVNAILVSVPRFAFETIGALLVCGYLVVIHVSGGDKGAALVLVGTFALSATRLLPTLQQMFQSVSAFFTTQAGVQKITALIEQYDADQDLVGHDNSLKLKEGIKLEQVSFQFPNNPRILEDGSSPQFKFENLQLFIPAKKMTSIIGPSGSGKTTLVKLIIGLIKPDNGRMVIDGMPLDNASSELWLNSIAYVPQKTNLLNDTIRTNVAFGATPAEIDDQKVMKCLKAVGLDRLALGRQGLDLRIGENGDELSGGQSQRLAIARALYQDVTAIFLDEATSALDKTTERDLLYVLSQLSKEMTVVVVAHRQAVIDASDVVIDISACKA